MDSVELFEQFYNENLEKLAEGKPLTEYTYGPSEAMTITPGGGAAGKAVKKQTDWMKSLKPKSPPAAKAKKDPYAVPGV